MESALVVGGAGFIGSHLIDRLVSDGVIVDAVDDLSSGSLANLADARRMGGSLKFHTLDIRHDEFDSLVALRRPEVIYHLAAMSAAQADDPASVATTVAVLSAAARHGVSKVVVALPAGDLYGEVPARELPIKESRPYPAGSIRGVYARAIIDLLAVFRAEHNLEHTALAMTSVYGSRQRPQDGVVASFVDARLAGTQLAVHGDGRQSRDLLFIDDAVDALVRSGSRGSGLVINIGTGTATPIQALAAELADGVGSTSAPRRRGDLARISVAVTRARIHLAWEPWTTLPDGLTSTLEAGSQRS